MIGLESSLLKENRNYVTVPVLKIFCKEHKLKNSSLRQDLLDSIENFANKNIENEKIVLDYFDKCFKEGEKVLKIDKIINTDFFTKEVIQEKVHVSFPKFKQSHILKANQINELSLINYVIQEDDQNSYVKQINFIFCIQVLTGRYPKETTGQTIVYPVFVDVDLENGFIIGRAKSTSVLFEYDGENLEFNDRNKKSYLYYINKAMEKVLHVLGVKKEEKTKSINAFRRAVFYLLESVTVTPDEISQKMDLFSENITEILNQFQKIYDMKLPPDLLDSAKYDLRIFVEKFLSITHPDEEIFIKDRDAYPYRISVRDHEYVTVDETAGLRQPIQRKEAFFDNKKAIFYNKLCDKVYLCYKRVNDKYFGKTPYRVSVEMKKESCLVSFPEYVREEDIQNVLSRIIEYCIV